MTGLWQGLAERVEHCCVHIDILDDLVAPLAAAEVRVIQDKWRVAFPGHFVALPFADEPVVAVVGTVVCHKDKETIVPEVEPVHCV